jgi:hypothetical protein
VVDSIELQVFATMEEVELAVHSPFQNSHDSGNISDDDKSGDIRESNETEVAESKSAMPTQLTKEKKSARFRRMSTFSSASLTGESLTTSDNQKLPNEENSRSSDVLKRTSLFGKYGESRVAIWSIASRVKRTRDGVWDVSVRKYHQDKHQTSVVMVYKLNSFSAESKIHEMQRKAKAMSPQKEKKFLFNVKYTSTDMSRYNSDDYVEFQVFCIYKSLQWGRYLIIEFDPSEFKDLYDSGRLNYEEVRVKIESTNDLYDFLDTKGLYLWFAGMVNAVQIACIVILLNEQVNVSQVYLREADFVVGAFLVYPIMAVSVSCLFTDGLTEATRIFFSKRLEVNDEPLTPFQYAAVFAYYLVYVLCLCMFFPLVIIWKLIKGKLQNEEVSFITRKCFAMWSIVQDIVLLVTTAILVVSIICSQQNFINMLFNFAGVLVVLQIDELIIKVVNVEFKRVRVYDKNETFSSHHLRLKNKSTNYFNAVFCATISGAIYISILVAHLIHRE